MVAVKVLLAFVGRPSHGSHLRRTWNVAHWWMGRLLLLLGIVLVYDGLLLYRNGRSKSWIAQCSGLSLQYPCMLRCIPCGNRGLGLCITKKSSMADVVAGNYHASHARYVDPASSLFARQDTMLCHDMQRTNGSSSPSLRTCLRSSWWLLERTPWTKPSFLLQLLPRACSPASSPPLTWCASTFYDNHVQGPLFGVMHVEDAVIIQVLQACMCGSFMQCWLH